MGNKTETELTDRTEEILEDGTSNLIFTVALIKSQQQYSLSKISQIVPNEVKHIINVFDDSRDLDISDITELNDIREVEYPVGNRPKDLRNFSHWGDIVELDIDTKPTASSLGDLTGTVTFTADSTAVTGSGTAFTTELEEGWYIKGGSTWYRISTITDDTNLVLVLNVATADAGAATTGYWYQYACLTCSKVHYLSQLTDLVGAIDLAAGYEKGAMLIHIDGLQASGTLKKNTVFTIKGVSSSYRVTEDATISSNECDVKISPSLAGNVGNDAVVTIRSSSLTSELERILPEHSAGMVAKNWVGDLRTQIDSSISANDLANAEIDKITARITQIRDTDIPAARSAVNAKLTVAQSAIALLNAQIDSAVTAAGKIDTAIGDYTATGQEIVTSIELANTQLDLAIADLVLMQTDITDNDAAFDAAMTAVNTALDKAVTDIASGDSLINTITIGGNPIGRYQGAAMAQVNTARGFVAEAMALQREKNDYNELARAELLSAQTSLNEGRAYLSLEGQITRENALAVSAYVSAAGGYAREASSYLQSDAQQVASFGRVISNELSAIGAEVSQAGGYFREARSRLQVSPAINSLQRWANDKIAQAEEDLRRISVPRQKQYNYPTG